MSREALRPSLRLPITWAIGCTTFSGIVEFTSLVSPTSLLLNVLRQMGVLEFDDDVHGISLESQHRYQSSSSLGSKIFFWDEKSTQTLGDFALGGATAGTIFQGNSINSTLPKENGVSQGVGNNPSKIVSSLVKKRNSFCQ